MPTKAQMRQKGYSGPIIPEVEEEPHWSKIPIPQVAQPPVPKIIREQRITQKTRIPTVDPWDAYRRWLEAGRQTLPTTPALPTRQPSLLGGGYYVPIEEPQRWVNPQPGTYSGGPPTAPYIEDVYSEYLGFGARREAAKTPKPVEPRPPTEEEYRGGKAFREQTIGAREEGVMARRENYMTDMVYRQISNAIGADIIAFGGAQPGRKLAEGTGVVNMNLLPAYVPDFAQLYLDRYGVTKEFMERYYTYVYQDEANQGWVKLEETYTGGTGGGNGGSVGYSPYIRMTGPGYSRSSTSSAGRLVNWRI